MLLPNIISRVTVRFAAKEKEPEGLFREVFHDIVKKSNEENEKKFKKAVQWLQEQIGGDSASHNLSVVSLEVKMGKFKGHAYITSSPLTVKGKTKFKSESDEIIVKFLEFLRDKYSPKFLVKSLNEDGSVTFNIR